MSNFTKISKQELLHFLEGCEEMGEVSFEAQDLGVEPELIGFIKDEHIQIEGIFSANEKLYVVFSRIVTPDELGTVKEKGIFAKLKYHGSSGKYKGIVDCKGCSIIPTQYYSIVPFMNDIMKIENKGNKFGLIRLSGEVILSPIYDRIDSLHELIFAVCKNGKQGFMNLKGETVIPFEYEQFDGEIAFFNGLACVQKLLDDGTRKFGYINHNNDVVIPFQFTANENFKDSDYIDTWDVYEAGYGKTVDHYKLALDGTVLLIDSEHHEDTSWYSEWEATHPYDESRRYDDDDSLDAFEGDASNRWNID